MIKNLCNLITVHFEVKYLLSCPLCCFLYWHATTVAEIDAKIGEEVKSERSSFSSEMKVAKLSATPSIEVRFVNCNESAIKRWLSSELEETAIS